MCLASPTLRGLPDALALTRLCHPIPLVLVLAIRPRLARPVSQVPEPPVIAELYVCFIARSVLSRHPLVPLSTRPRDNFKRRGEAHGTRPVSRCFLVSGTPAVHLGSHRPSSRVVWMHLRFCWGLRIRGSLDSVGWLGVLDFLASWWERSRNGLFVSLMPRGNGNTRIPFTLSYTACVRLPERKLWSHSCRARVGADTLRVCGGLWIQGEVTEVDRCLSVQLEWGCRTSYRTLSASLPV